MFYYTYVLKSRKDGKLYIGFSANLKKRLKAHNNGEVSSTKNRLPFDLVYFEGCLSKQLAEKRELYFKTGFGRKFLKSRM